MNLPPFLNACRACAIEMMNNALFIQKHLPSLSVPDGLRHEIEQLCEDWIGAKFDVLSEIDELGENVTKGASNECQNRYLERINRSLIESAESALGCVVALRAAAEQGKIQRSVAILVTESATNVLTASNAIPNPPLLPIEIDSSVSSELNLPGVWCDAEEPEVFAFLSEDFLIANPCRKAVDRLLLRGEQEEDTKEGLETLKEGLARLPEVTDGIDVSLSLKFESNGESDWLELRLTDDEFELSDGTYTQLGGGEVHTNVIFTASPSCRAGDTLSGSVFAQRFLEAASDEAREIVIHVY